MAGPDSVPVDAVMANGVENGVNSHSPRQPSLSGLSLTEYSANPSPPSEDHQARIRNIVPEEFILPNGHPDYLRLILTSRVYEACKETSLTPATNLSNRLECKVLLKREDEQPVFSFKLRGAYNKMAHLDRADSWKGVVACSAGNHAQGVAYSARLLKMPATIVMPRGTPSIKHRNVSRMGGCVVLHGQDFDAAKEEGKRLQEVHGLIDIPPFDDPYVIAGQGTIGMELLRQTNIQKLEAVFCCVGGGGLIAGIGVYIKRIAPHVKIIGVEAEDANAMVQSLREKKRVVLKQVGLFADGAAVKTVGEETFRIASEVVDEVILVNTDEICAAIKDVFEDTRSIVEPAGALSLAGLKKWVAANPSGDPNRSVVAVTSGANMNFDRLRFVAERATLGEGKEALLCVSIPERPGAFAELINNVMPHAVTEFSYRYATDEVANVLVGISLSGAASQRAAELQALTDRITGDPNAKMTVTDLSGDELAKSHVRYLVGGRSDVAHERLYMFNFPERPGALEKFLRTLRLRFNISLFQYRNNGSDVGKILAGVQCPDAEVPGLEDRLREIGYPWTDCTQSDVFKTFLRS
ncbi:hypothetical protein DL764_008683 [Monosporascus ibericus]|uniref:Threonine dehydratase n=1 Tax=Monosporascus ibericus TaxID=155417 RepID=A0A4Q4SZV8_9PEZI|nr:hypothetical protein DL764_008683 [Monosporascus ibericus]